MFARKLLLKNISLRGMFTAFTAQEELEALRVLESLLQEQEVHTPKFPSFARPQSTTFPPLSLSPLVKMFVKLAVDKLPELPSKWEFDNLSYEQRTAMKKLSKRRDIVIKPADKGGNVVVWPCDLYEAEANR